MNLPSGEMRVRPMTAADLRPAMEIAAGLQEAPRWADSAYLAAVDPEALPRRIALAAEDPERGVEGFAVACMFGPEAELETIAVAVESQRRGVGRRLMAALEAELKRKGVQKLHLEVRASNWAAQVFYRALGFEETGRRPLYYADPVEDAVLMRLSLECASPGLGVGTDPDPAKVARAC
jgi:ribosomal-protein-alanine N-acetyltransferase